MEPKVGILLNSYNGEKFIAKQIQSIISQTYANWNLLVYDDCSTDKTLEIVGKIAQADKRVSIFKNKKNFGLIYSFKKGVKMIKADYISISDQDNFWLPSRLEEQVSYFQEHPKCLMVCHDSFVSDSNLSIISSSFTKTLNKNILSLSGFDTTKYYFENLLDNNQVAGFTIMFRSNIINSVSMLPNSEMHDSWTAKIAAGNGRIGYIPKSLAVYRQHENNYVGSGTTTNAFYFSALFDSKWQKIYIKRANDKIKALKILKRCVSKKNLNHHFINRKIIFYRLTKKLASSNLKNIFGIFFKSLCFSVRYKYFYSIKYFCFFLFNKLFTILLNNKQH